MALAAPSWEYLGRVFLRPVAADSFETVSQAVYHHHWVPPGSIARLLSGILIFRKNDTEQSERVAISAAPITYCLWVHTHV